jgi:sodium-dependent phosphate cotransporter
MQFTKRYQNFDDIILNHFCDMLFEYKNLLLIKQKKLNMIFEMIGILAALTAPPNKLKYTLQLAFCHLLFNISGIILFYPIPFMRFPITLARMLGNVTAKYRWFSVLYLIMMFFLLPLFVFGLSLASIYALAGVGLPLLVVLILVVIINIIQRKKPSLLPLKLQNWNFLPLWMHSLEPADAIVSKLVEKFTCLTCCAPSQSRHDSAALGQSTNQSQLHILGSMKNSNSDNQLKHVYDNDGYVIQWKGIENSKDSDKEVTIL